MGTLDCRSPIADCSRRVGVVLLLLAAPPLMLHTLWSNPVSAGEDDVLYYYPLRKMVGQALREGRWPIENPREAGGSVLLADPQSAVFHPTTWLFAAGDAKTAYSLSIFAAFWLAGGGAYLYLRRLGLARIAGLFGAIVFMFCGYMVGHRVHLSMILTAAMLPWGLWCIERLRTRGTQPPPAGATSVRVFAWLVAVFYLAIAAGHWPTLIHVTLIWGIYFLLRARPLGKALCVTILAGAMALWMVGPQLIATFEILGQTTRARIGYATAGENSFFPLAGMLALFPFFFGSRTPGFFPQRWWGPWHLCEMLGYVGLVTLILAAAAVFRLYRKKGGRTASDEPQSAAEECPRTVFDPSLVRVWTWIAAGAMVWMLGYYLPTYRLIHRLPVLGVVRCPARMVLAVEMALATLAAVAIHTLGAGGAVNEGRRERLAKTIRRGACIYLPAIMLAALLLIVGGAWLLYAVWPGRLPGFQFFVGGADDALRAVQPNNPAVWLPFVAAVVTVAAICFWLRQPRRRAGLLVVLILADLFVLTRFVDVPAADTIAPDPEVSPAAAWLKKHAPAADEYRIWGLGDPYGDRQAELLLSKTCQSLGFHTISNYGPFQSPRHAHLLGFRIFGTNRDWARLVRTNNLLSLYNVRFLIAEAGSEYSRTIESVQIPGQKTPPDGPNLLAGPWSLDHGESRGDVLVFRTPFLWRFSQATQPVALKGETIYRIALAARGPDGGAANFLQADILSPDFHDDAFALRASAEQIAPEWRHFEWTFETPAEAPSPALLRIFTMSERPIEVRNVSVRRGSWPEPVGADQVLETGDEVYRKLVELDPLRRGEPKVAIYANRAVQLGNLATDLSLRSRIAHEVAPEDVLAVTTLAAGAMYAALLIVLAWNVILRGDSAGTFRTGERRRS